MGLAARGLRDLDHGTEPVADPAEREQLRRQGRMVYVQAAVAAAGLTTLAILA